MKTLFAVFTGLLMLAAAAVAPASAGDSPKLAVLDTQLIDYQVTSRGDPLSTPEDVKRVTLASDVLRERMAETGLFDVLPEAAESDAYEDVVDLSCPYCILDIAERLGADYVMTSAVLRVSNIILYFKAEIDNVATGKAVYVGEVSFKDFKSEAQLRGAAEYWLDVHGGDLRTALETETGS